jgi:hypothetical protein
MWVVQVPVRAVAEALGGQVEFKREHATVEVRFGERSELGNPIIAPD